jgi:hypothetical protein
MNTLCQGEKMKNNSLKFIKRLHKMSDNIKYSQQEIIKCQIEAARDLNLFVKNSLINSRGIEIFYLTI